MLSRRSFLRVAASVGGAALVAPRFGAAADPAPAARPKGLPDQIIDTHTHFYDPTRPEGIPWPGKGDATLYKPTLPEHFRKVAVPHGATGTVVVEASPRLEDNQWLLDLAEKDPFLVGIVGNLSPGEEGFRRHIARFAKNSLYRGFRINGGDLPKRLEQDEFVADLKRVADLDLELDINGGPTMLPGIALLAEKVPDLRIVINHVANLRNDGKAPDPDWVKGMAACAKGKNVFCKVSALAEGATRKDADGLAPKETGYYVPLLDAVWKIWGDDRVIYGSNWPVSARAASYADVQRVVFEYVSPKGKTATEKFFAGNARTAYKWVDRKAAT
jgi:predicted TIM-barrel fold metal-dependent hydrolase